MNIAFLGFIETLQKVFEGIFDMILTPVLTDITTILFNKAGAFIMGILGKLLLQFLVIILKIVDFLSAIFDIFSGTRYVHVTDGLNHVLQTNEYRVVDGVTKIIPKGTMVNYRQEYLLDAFLERDEIRQAFLMISLFAAGIAFLLTIFVVAKSVSDMAMTDKNPVGKVLGRGLKAAVTFLMTPILVIFMLQLSSIVVVRVSNTIADSGGTGTPPTLGTIIFLTGGLNAAKDEAYNKNPSFTDGLRMKYYNGTASYSNMEQLERDFDPAKFDIVTAVVSTLLMIIILILSIFLFVGRIFEVIILYLVSPLFVSTMPIDDGAMYGKWRDLFVAKLFSGFGVVFTMKMFLTLVPLISGPSITLHTDPVINSILKMFIIIGGAWAAFKSQHLILQILHPEAAMAAQAQTAAIMGLVVGLATGGAGLAMSAAGAVTGKGGGGGGGGGKGGGGGGGGGAGQAAKAVGSMVVPPEGPQSGSSGQAFRGGK
ncbi:MAG: hypothetical protein RR276_04770 [Angelakisella sp.]